MSTTATPTWDVLYVKLCKARQQARAEKRLEGAPRPSTLMRIGELLAETQAAIAIDDARVGRAVQ